jgi:RNA polymerase primary sigma factor
VKYLSREEERETARLAKKGNKKALDRLILSNLRFVQKIASRYRGRGISEEDLVNEGIVYMILSLKRFDPNRDTRFKSLAYWWVIRGMIQALGKTMIITPPSKGYLSERVAPHIQSTDEAGDDLCIVLADPKPQGVAEEIDRKDRAIRLRKILCKLSVRERIVIRLRFGINRRNPATLREIGEELNISAERARQILKGAMAHLKVKLVDSNYSWS